MPTRRTRPRRATRARVAAACAAAAVASVGTAPVATADELDEGQWWRSAMGVQELHASGSGKGITVAVIDGPIDSGVPELKGRVASSWTECLDPDGGTERPTVSGPAADHATKMASLIVGSGKGTASGGRGVAGIAPGATLRHYAVTFPAPSQPDALRCGLRDPSVNVVGEATARAISRAVKDGADVISISLRTDYSSAYAAALLEAYRAGAIVVAATDNETRKVFWPAIGNGVVTVTHVDSAANLDTSAVRGSSLVDFAAPGSKVAGGAWTPDGWRSDVVQDGASQATAIAAGGLAAMWSAHPTATGNQVLNAAKDAIGIRAKDGKFFTWFRRVGANLPKATGKTESYGFGIFAPADAVKLDLEAQPTTNPMVADRPQAEPAAAEIAAVTPAAATASTTPTGTASPTASPPGATEAANEQTWSDTSEGGSSVWPWLGSGLALLLAALAIVMARRRSARSPGGPPNPQTTDTHDPTTAADGAAATTKEPSHG